MFKQIAWDLDVQQISLQTSVLVLYTVDPDHTLKFAFVTVADVKVAAEMVQHSGRIRIGDCAPYIEYALANNTYPSYSQKQTNSSNSMQTYMPPFSNLTHERFNDDALIRYHARPAHASTTASATATATVATRNLTSTTVSPDNRRGRGFYDINHY